MKCLFSARNAPRVPAAQIAVRLFLPLRLFKVCRHSVRAFHSVFFTVPQEINSGIQDLKSFHVSGSLEIEGDPDDVNAIIESLASTLGVDMSLLVLSDDDQRRREALKVSFTIFADPNELGSLQEALDSPALVSAMTTDLESKGISAKGEPCSHLPVLHDEAVTACGLALLPATCYHCPSLTKFLLLL